MYQTSDMNGHVLEYTALTPDAAHINGGIHGGYGQMLPQGCHHLHHKLPDGLALLNGSGGLFSPGLPHGHDGARDCAHSHPHHLLNVRAAAPPAGRGWFYTRLTLVLSPQGGGVYTALSQAESSDCMSCQNLCNNNR